MSCGVIDVHWWLSPGKLGPKGDLRSEPNCRMELSSLWTAVVSGVLCAHLHMCTCATVPFVQYIIVSTLQLDLLLCEAEIFVHCAETRRGLQLFSSFTGILEKLQLSTALQCKILKLQNTWMETDRVQANVTSANRVFKRQWKSAPRQHMGPLWELNGSMEQAHIVNWGTACAGTSPPTK